MSKSEKSKRMVITLHSDDRLGYGLSICSSPKTNVAVISSIIPGGPADLYVYTAAVLLRLISKDILTSSHKYYLLKPTLIIYRCERLQINDRILSINGMPIAGVTSDPQPLHKVPGVALGAIELAVEYEIYNTCIIASDNILTVELTKYNKKNLGITVTGWLLLILVSIPINLKFCVHLFEVKNTFIGISGGY